MKAIIGAVLIDGAGGPPISDSVVVVAGSRIRSAGRRADVPIPARADKIDGRGKFLVPGLIDLHVHPGSRAGMAFVPADHTADRIRRNLDSYLYFGVTTVRSLGADQASAFEVRKAEREGAFQSARLFTFERGFSAPGGHPAAEIGEFTRQPDSPAAARKQLEELAALGADGVKIWVDDRHGQLPKIKPDIVLAILDEARKFKLPVTAHAVTLADVRFLVDNGAAGFVHMARDTEDLDPALLARLRNLQTVFAPTLVRQELAWYYKEHPERLNDPEIARAADAATIQEVRSASAGLNPGPAAREEFGRAMRNTRRMAAAGVPIGVGSDGGSDMDFPGIGTHRELELLSEAGLSPMEVLQSATRTGALALQKLEELGTLQPGRRADLLLLSGNPLEDVRNFRKIDRMMLEGQWIDRQSLKLP